MSGDCCRGVPSGLALLRNTGPRLIPFSEGAELVTLGRPLLLLTAAGRHALFLSEPAAVLHYAPLHSVLVDSGTLFGQERPLGRYSEQRTIVRVHTVSGHALFGTERFVIHAYPDGQPRALEIEMLEDTSLALPGPTKIANIKRGQPYNTYIGRTMSAEYQDEGWGNTIRKNKTCPVCTSYHDGPLTMRPCFEKVLVQKIATFGLAAFLALRGRTLGCWCAPGPCHGDLMAEVLDSLP